MLKAVNVCMHKFYYTYIAVEEYDASALPSPSPSPSPLPSPTMSITPPNDAASTTMRTPPDPKLGSTTEGGKDNASSCTLSMTILQILIVISLCICM